MGGNSIPYRPLIPPIAPLETPRSLTVVPLIQDQRYYGEAMVGLAGWSGAALEQSGARGSAIWGVKLGSEGSPRREERAKGQRRMGTANCRTGLRRMAVARGREQSHE